jgi:hypothetical protein
MEVLMRPMTFPPLVCALAWLGLAPNNGRAQRLEPGQRVRVTYDCVITVSRIQRDESCRQIEGLLIGRDSTGLTLARSVRSAPARLPFPAITRVQISVGWRGHPTQGALLGGLLLGAVTAFGTNAVLNAAYCDSPSCGLSGFALVWGFLPGFGIGAAIGQAVGAAVTSDRWQDVPRDRLDPPPGLSRRRLRLGWSFSF